MRKSFIIHNDSLAVLEELTDEQCGQLFRAIKAYQLGEDIELSPIAKIAFSPFKNQFVRDADKYQNIVDRNKLNGSKGGRPKNPKEPSGLLGNPEKPQKADSVSKSVSKSKSDSKEIVIPDGINQSAWIEWVEFRKQSKKKITPAAAKKQFKLLSDYAFDLQQQIIDQSIQNDYQGLFAPKGNTNDQSNRPNQAGTRYKLSVVERTRIANQEREVARQARAGNGSAMGEAPRDIRPPTEQPVRADNPRELGETLDGSFTRTD